MSAETLPRYAEIRQTLEQAIISGDWPAGHRVPSEHELMVQYGCSRMTVNKALSALAEAGLIRRRRRAGTFVAARGSEESVLKIHDIRAEITASGRQHHYRLLERVIRKATAEDARRLQLSTGAKIMAIRACHDADAQPFALEDRLLNLATVPDIVDAPLDQIPAGSWLLEKIPWTDAEHQIRAVNADAVTARGLQLDRGAACLQVDRTTWRDGATITQVRLTYPGESHVLLGRFSPMRNV